MMLDSYVKNSRGENTFHSIYGKKTAEILLAETRGIAYKTWNVTTYFAVWKVGVINVEVSDPLESTLKILTIVDLT